MNQPTLYVTLCGPGDETVAELKISIPLDDWRDDHLAPIQLHGTGPLDTKNWTQQNRMLAARRAYLARLTDRVNRDLTKALAKQDVVIKEPAHA